MAPRPLAVATIVAKNYLSLARVMADSLHRRHPDVPVFVLLSDDVAGHFDPAAESFHLVRLPDVGIPELQRVRFRYARKELAVAAKPYLLSHVLDRGFRAALFLDPDILVLGELTSLFSHVQQHAAVLVPHVLAPLTGEARAGRELDILRSGTYNAGCIGVSDHPSARQFLRWWQRRVFAHCRHDVAAGVYYDQRWLDLAPIFFEDVFVLRDPTYNVAHWNLPERRLDIRGDAVVVDGQPCRFFHFSGFDPDRPDAVTRYSPRLRMNDIGSAAELFRRYVALLDSAGYRETKTWPYAYDRFDNGVAVTDRMRAIYRDLGTAAGRFGDPLVTTERESFFAWLKRAGELPRAYQAGDWLRRFILGQRRWRER
jgi:hypothetical protein